MVLIRVFFPLSFSMVESRVFCKIRLYTNFWPFRDYPMFIGVFPSFTFSGRSRSGVFCKVCFTYTYVWLFRGYSTLIRTIRGFSQFRFQWSRPFLGSFARHADKQISDHLGTIQCWSYWFFPSFVFHVQTSGRSKSFPGSFPSPADMHVSD